MDDTAFHYSRTLRVIMILAIVIPIVVIGAILWYYTTDVPATAPDEAGSATDSDSTSGTPVSCRAATLDFATDLPSAPLWC
jgi:hypothetical protein